MSQKTPPSQGIPFALIAGIVLFGSSSAYMVLRGDTVPSQTESHRPLTSYATQFPKQPGFAPVAAPSVAAGAAPAAAPAPSPSLSSSPSPAAATVSLAVKAAAWHVPTPVLVPVHAPFVAPVAQVKAEAPAMTKPVTPPAPRPAVTVRPAPARVAIEQPRTRNSPELLKPADASPIISVAPAAFPSPATAAAIAAPAAPVIRDVTAKPLVPTQDTPSVVAATAAQAWVKVNDHQTVIIKKGQSLTGLGTFQGVEGTSAKFDNKSITIKSNE